MLVLVEGQDEINILQNTNFVFTHNSREGKIFILIKNYWHVSVQLSSTEDFYRWGNWDIGTEVLSLQVIPPQIYDIVQSLLPASICGTADIRSPWAWSASRWRRCPAPRPSARSRPRCASWSPGWWCRRGSWGRGPSRWRRWCSPSLTRWLESWAEPCCGRRATYPGTCSSSCSPPAQNVSIWSSKFYTSNLECDAGSIRLCLVSTETHPLLL